MIISYFDQLRKMADARGVDLLEAFVDAQVPTSTFYRTRKGSDLSFRTAEKVALALERINS